MTVPALPYADARALVREGDVLLFESTGPVAAVIRWATRSRYSHAGLAAWWGERLLCVESRERKGCRAVPLSFAARGARVTAYRCSVVPAPATLLTDAAAARLGAPYGWWSILLDAVGALPLLALLARFGVLRRLPVVGPWLSRLPWGKAYSEDDLDDPGVAVKCSTLVALAYREAGVDLVPNLSDRSTTPGDLARSALLYPVVEIVP